MACLFTFDIIIDVSALEGNAFEKTQRTAERLLLAGALLCSGSNGLKAAEIPPESPWAIGIEQLYKDGPEETGAIHLCANAKDGAQHDRWVISVPGTPMDDYRPKDVEEWIGKAREKGETVDCYVDAHNDPPALQKIRYGERLPNPLSMPPGTGDLWSIYHKSVDAKNLGVSKTFAIVVDGLGMWTYAPTAEMTEFQAIMVDYLHDSEKDAWAPDVGMAVNGWLKEVNRKTPGDVPKLLESQAYKNLQVAYQRSGFTITYQSLETATHASPRAYMGSGN